MMQPIIEHRSCTNVVPFKKYAAIFGVLFLFGILLGCASLFFFTSTAPTQQHWFAIREIGLPGSEERQLYTKSPVPMEVRIYLFHVTNKEDVIHGAKPVLQEIGPYVFEEWMEKFNFTDNAADDTLTFNMKKTLIFRPDLSNGLTGNESITMVHPLIMGIVLSLNVKRKPMLKFVNKAINAMYHHPTDPFWTGRVMDYLFNGIEINCTSEDFAAKAVCSVFDSGQVKTIQPLREDYYKFSVFGAMNGSGIGTYKVNRGIKSNREVGRVITFDDKTEMDVWGGDECNRYRGTDSTIFPVEIQKEDGLWMFEPDICMSIGTHYERDSKYQDIPTIRFGLDFGDARKKKKLECYCIDPPNDCPRRGTRDLFDCIEAPIVLSLPHFYNADPSLLTQIHSGLNPNENEHSFFMDYETASGNVPNAVKRLQVNLDIVPVDAVESMKDLPTVLMPLFWMEEISALPPPNNQSYTNTPNYQQHLLTLQILQWMAIITGAVGSIFSTYMHFKVRTTTTVVNIKSTEDRANVMASNAVYKVSGVSVN